MRELGALWKGLAETCKVLHIEKKRVTDVSCGDIGVLNASI
jgi:hypothetical protein